VIGSRTSPMNWIGRSSKQTTGRFGSSDSHRDRARPRSAPGIRHRPAGGFSLNDSRRPFDSAVRRCSNTSRQPTIGSLCESDEITSKALPDGHARSSDKAPGADELPSECAEARRRSRSLIHLIALKLGLEPYKRSGGRYPVPRSGLLSDRRRCGQYTIQCGLVPTNDNPATRRFFEYGAEGPPRNGSRVAVIQQCQIRPQAALRSAILSLFSLRSCKCSIC
jgi:hypothetical protein